MDEKTYFSLVARLDQLRKDTSKTQAPATPSTVTFLEGELAKTTDPLHRAALYQLMAQEYALAKQPSGELGTMRRAAAEFPGEPVPWIGLAARLGQEQKMLNEARVTIERGLEIASRTNRFVRYALGTRARIANALNDRELLEETVQRLIADAAKTRAEDCGFETDFLDSIPDDAIDRGMREQYLKIAEAKRKAPPSR